MGMLLKSLVAVFATTATTAENSAQCQSNCVVSYEGRELITRFEGYSPLMYKDSAGLPTIGVGHLIKPGEQFEEPMTPEEVDTLLQTGLRVASKAINRVVTVPLWQNQYDALASFTFNVGGTALKRSTLLKRVNAERWSDVPGELLKWVYAGGVKIRGLVIRRRAEGDYFMDVPSM